VNLDKNDKHNSLHLRIDLFQDMVLTMSCRGIIAELSRSSIRIIGRHSEKMIGLSLRDFLTEQCRAEFDKLLIDMRFGMQAPPVQMYMTHAQGRQVPVELSITALKNESCTIGYQALIREGHFIRQPADADETDHGADQFAILQDLVRHTLTSDGEGDPFQAALPSVLALTSHDQGAIYRLMPGREFSRIAVRGETGLFPENFLVDSSPESLLPEEILGDHNLLDAEGRSPLLLEKLRQTGCDESLLLPLIWNNTLKGVLVLASREGHSRAAWRQKNNINLNSILTDLLSQIFLIKDLKDDVTDLQTRFDDLVKSSTDHIWEVDRNGRYTYNSPSLEQVLGYRPEQVKGRHPLEFVHPDDLDHMKSLLGKIMAQKIPMRGMINRVLRADGLAVYIESRSFPMFDHRGEIRGYRGVDRNITDWFKAKKTLEETLFGTCEALSRMVELRDPYTRGHSVRVSELMVLIGKQMDYSRHELLGLRLMGLLHDIGKIGIPAQILAKPGRLSGEEMDLIRQHPGMGYQILKGIDFPWPVAPVVLQHHERLDGSGYPRGLRGEEMPWQARLLAVCDLLEAMATDRPYRPGLGLDKALAELRLGRGTLFDSRVVDTVFSLQESGRLAAVLNLEQTATTPSSRIPADDRMLEGDPRKVERKPQDHPDFILLSLTR
jgi:PAS domain S-box-containing protein